MIDNYQSTNPIYQSKEVNLRDQPSWLNHEIFAFHSPTDATP